ncbi:hypothetical protein QYE76_067109 [Lolium multiflorum]|uniref:Dof zinc finger protein n=1 Tax=Lolium multiflorum TaxID=4521 RepID=A0AAD8SC74_LOLMU|nr:hypothetical protein QYE76_067109 [Lolium multiflorum]
MASTAIAAGDEAVGQQQQQQQQRKGGTGGGSGTPPPPPAEQGLRCPRCDSPNTKFCYYNNYSLSQPRHFCKTCRRYWTKGGALRNVPVGGGCRKNKRSRSAASSSARGLSLNLPAAVESIDAASDQHAARMGGAFPGGDFHGVVGMLPGLHQSPAVVSHYVPFGEWPSGGDVNSGHAMNGSGAGNGAMGNSTIASSIESLSFINQDLHWKLQQQRVATMFLGPTSSSSHSHVDGGGHVAAGAQFGGAGTFLQMAGVSGMDTVPAATSWFMDSSYALPSPPPPAAAVGTTSSNINSGRSSGGAGDDNATSNNNNNCGSAIPSWGDISTFAMLP